MRKILAVALLAILAPLSLVHAQTPMTTKKPMMGGKMMSGKKMSGKKMSGSKMMMGKKKMSGKKMSSKKMMPMRDSKGRFMKSSSMTKPMTKTTTR